MLGRPTTFLSSTNQITVLRRSPIVAGPRVARCSSVLRVFAHGAVGRRIDPSWGGPNELFLVPASAPRLVKQRPWYMLSCLCDGAYKRTLAVNRKEQPMWQHLVSSLAITMVLNHMS